MLSYTNHHRSPHYNHFQCLPPASNCELDPSFYANAGQMILFEAYFPSVEAHLFSYPTAEREQPNEQAQYCPYNTAAVSVLLESMHCYLPMECVELVVTLLVPHGGNYVQLDATKPALHPLPPTLTLSIYSMIKYLRYTLANPLKKLLVCSLPLNNKTLLRITQQDRQQSVLAVSSHH